MWIWSYDAQTATKNIRMLISVGVGYLGPSSIDSFDSERMTQSEVT